MSATIKFSEKNWEDRILCEKEEARSFDFMESIYDKFRVEDARCKVLLYSMEKIKAFAKEKRFFLCCCYFCLYKSMVCDLIYKTWGSL